MNNKRLEIYLAALLHDIGKFYQRADDQGSANSKILSDHIKKLETTLCPLRNGSYSHKHVLWTAQFLEDKKKHFQEIIRGSESSLGYMINLAAGHHDPKNDTERIIQKADHYSSGADRSNNDNAWKDAEEENDRSWDSFRRIKMRSVFEAVSLYNYEGTEKLLRGSAECWEAGYQNKLPLKALKLGEDYFPVAEDNSMPDYSVLWDQFSKEFDNLPCDSIRSFSETFLFLLEKYTSRIPSSTQHLPDVSLYDHLKTTAAFAVCLYDYMEAYSLSKIPAPTDKPFLLVGGDLSGIQKFIYGIIARGAAKNLKGRSFYLHLLADNIVKKMVRELELFQANIIYSSGGCFYLLAPNTERTRQIIGDLSKHIEDQLFEYHKTDLYLSIEHVEFGESDLFFKPGSDHSIGEIWDQLAIRLTQKSGQRFEHKIRNAYSGFFEPGESGGTRSRDAITGEEIRGSEEKLDSYTVSGYTFEQIQLGRVLRDTDYWIVADESLDYFPKNASDFEPIGIGMHNYFVSRSFFEEADVRDQLRLSADKVTAIAMNEIDFLSTLQKGNDNIYGFGFYGGNHFPVVSKDLREPRNFMELCDVVYSDRILEAVDKKPALVRMGILRMDVDNLGAIFRKGLSADKRSFSRYSSLSRSLDYYFKGYLNKIWERPEFKNNTQIIYSGGDDLFIVGKWDTVLRMAAEINSSFRKWTCGNPDLTLSGGVAIVYPKFPILKGSGMSETEEKNAKKHLCGNSGKNAFSLFGYAFNWDSEYKYLVSLKDEIKTLLGTETKDGLSRGFPSDVFHLMEQAGFEYDKNQNKYLITNYQVIWMMAYSMKRNAPGKNEEVQRFYRKWTNNIFTGRIEELNETKYHALQYLAIAARWASLELR